MPREKKVAGQIIELLDKCGGQDLAQLDATIADVQKTLDGLLAVRRVIDAKVNGRPRLKRGPKKRLPLADDKGDEEREESPAKPPGVADRIQEKIEQFGPQSVPQLAMKLATSEQGIRIAIGQAKGRFVMDEDQKFDLAEKP
jgi:hypothetical protein